MIDKKFHSETKFWAPVPETLPSLPFHVERSRHGALPVYTDIKAGGTKKITILRKCSGDIYQLQSEMIKVVEGAEVRFKPGRLEVDGDFKKRLARWLIMLGF